MRHLMLSAVAAAALLAAATASGVATAAPARPGAVAAPGSGLEAAQYRARPHGWRRGMHRRPMGYRGRVGRRAYAPSQSGNARNPERPVFQQQQGQTTGGPRY